MDELFKIQETRELKGLLDGEKVICSSYIFLYFLYFIFLPFFVFYIF